jgi:hypothetical protein
MGFCFQSDYGHHFLVIILFTWKERIACLSVILSAHFLFLYLSSQELLFQVFYETRKASTIDFDVLVCLKSS